MSLSMTTRAVPSTLPPADLSEGRKTASIVVLAFALLGAACVALGLTMTVGETGVAATPDCFGACWERVV